ncbi:MAG: hypothetical protein WDO73_20645 [Ignavibacteriota bacterium]
MVVSTIIRAPSSVREDAEHYRRDTSGRKLYDPAYKSCTAFISAVACERWGFRAPDLDDLVKWSLIIDGAHIPMPAPLSNWDLPR